MPWLLNSLQSQASGRRCRVPSLKRQFGPQSENRLAFIQRDIVRHVCDESNHPDASEDHSLQQSAHDGRYVHMERDKNGPGNT